LNGLQELVRCGTYPENGTADIKALMQDDPTLSGNRILKAGVLALIAESTTMMPPHDLGSRGGPRLAKP